VDVPIEWIRREEQAALEIEECIKSASTFQELLETHLRLTTSSRMIAVELQYELEWRARAAVMLGRIRALASFRRWPMPSREKNVCLDIGCGKGAMLPDLATLFEHVVGVEYYLPYLVFAKGLLQFEKVDNVTLVCGSAMALPFSDETFRFVSMIDVIEHLADQHVGVSEASRATSSDGFVYLNSPNRYNMLTPEDHVGLMWLGLVPRAFVKRYVRWRTGEGYEGVWPISRRKLRRLLDTLPGEYVLKGLVLTGSEPSPIKRFVRTVPGLLGLVNSVLRPVLPSYNALYRKVAAEGQ
jgi:ubiquinone/menaquinone biosynthesis C-methylase UbiE